MTAQQVIVFLVDDDPVHLLFLGGLLRTSGYRVEAFEQSEALLARLGPEDRGCALLDLQMPGLNGLDLQRALVERGVRLPLVFVSGRADVPAAVAAMKRGAVDFLEKPVDPDELRAVVERALRRDREVAAEATLRDDARARWAALSSRERDVCRLFARGYLNKQIAAELGTTESTVQTQRARALQKLGVGTASELARMMARIGDAG